ncbi:MAG: hypothetical protein OEO19_03800 [Gammaproteobacteria bacterium]|nr:hypothetical protein [Gammaproteobacteria bacterium]MDH3449820.1 hypothetical protein [Gammaproteobacteria bacterium]
MFEILFKYPAEFFAQGRLILALPWWQLALLPLAVLVVSFVLLGYFRLRGDTRPVDRIAIAILRSCAISLVMFALLRPMLEVSSRAPQPNVVGVLLDNSISMNIGDYAGAPRHEFIGRQFAAESGSLLRDLRQRFDTKLFKFGASTQPVNDIAALDYSAGASDLLQGLQQVQDALQGEPLAGLVVVSDGATGALQQLDERLLSLRSAGIPVHGIGLGQTSYPRDIEISGVELPERILQGSRVVADVAIRQRGYDAQTVDLVVEDDSRILYQGQIRLRPGLQSIEVPLSSEEAGPKALKFSVANQAREQIAVNNSRQAFMSVDDRSRRILYFEGEPRFELKFIRRAVADDENLRVSGLIRTADAKFYRVGIESEDELRNGFPITREELFSYDALILGSVELSLLSREQQQMIIEFVSRRGGGLMMLGGRHAFAEGGYRDSVLQAISPVIMAQQAQPEFAREIKIQPTAAALVHPALMVADSNEKSIARWLTLPPLTIVNPIRQIKPGATLLLTSATSGDDTPWVAMAMQRYGRGKVIAFPVQNSWLWQMHHEIDLQDQTHEILWRQLLRWLVEGVPERLSLTLSTHSVARDGVIGLRSEVLDPDYEPYLQARVRAIVTTPQGLEQIQPLSRHPSLDGVYEAEIAVADPGDYQLRVELEQGGEAISSATSRIEVTRDGAEYYRSEMNESLLRRIAAETGGGFFTPDDADAVVDALAAQQRGANALVRYELWDMPLLFVLLVLALSLEWGYRRWRNLV